MEGSRSGVGARKLTAELEGETPISSFLMISGLGVRKVFEIQLATDATENPCGSLPEVDSTASGEV